eukprot:gene52107-52281_t
MPLLELPSVVIDTFHQQPHVVRKLSGLSACALGAGADD